MKKLELITLLLSTLAEISTPVSLYAIINNAEHVKHDNRLPKNLQPVEQMVDATNHLGFKILSLHSNFNKNNIAFSPCGLMSVLVALYEGSSGRSRIELEEALEFPNERDIIRVGVRDIHRRLRSYFYKKENLLSGLIFNKENITIRPEYETVLRFYGYDLDGAMNMLTESKINETLSDMRDTMEATEATDLVDTTTMEDEMKVGDEGVTKNEQDRETTTETTEYDTSTYEVSRTEENTKISDDENEDTTTVAPSRKPRGRLGRGLKTETQQPYAKASLSRHSRSYYVLVDDDNEDEFNFDSTSPSSFLPLGTTSTAIPAFSPISPSNPMPPLPNYRHNNQKDLFQNVDSDTVEHFFYLNNYDTVRVPFKIYDTVMKFVRIETLQASIIEIDLDTEYYNLIIVIPDHPDGLNDLTNKLRLHEASTLRRIRSEMEYFWVKTIIPKFNLKGNTILTNDLQAMGVNDIFEPTKANFSRLADDITLYVKNVEQMININIRTQTTQQLKKTSTLYKHPIEVPVNIPFIYCVLDRELDLAIIMGRVLNPLNSRIQ
ncbi:CLUMA_CG016153, isoform A [Clunio marinus]|uniref:CLUMA_CG016153, isoform A n=1 Tax=Clunio marinus TaxID=568069 RepID=A0A1J1ITJ0_9DIPT|nr:CLUMA_CG016153, isoform A [Clunio marinus]